METRVPASASIVESWLWWHVLVIQTGRTLGLTGRPTPDPVERPYVKDQREQQGATSDLHMFAHYEYMFGLPRTHSSINEED